VTSWSCQRADAGHAVPIGHPIANMQIYLLDKSLQPVPIGVAGEVYIAGVGLARGDFEQPEITAEKFISNPFGEIKRAKGTAPVQPGRRLYRTGDLARSRADGTLEFLGRSDTQQVKLRGYRIELGEIEAALREHEAIEACVVLLRED